MTELLTAAGMRAIETAAIDSGAVTGLELMERAGAGVVEAVFEEWPDLAAGAHKAVVLCGPGNNGGDGFVVARLLQGRGWEVEVYLLGDAGRLPPDAAANYDRWCAMGPVRPLPPDLKPTARGQVALVVDALFGTGLTRPVSGLEPTLQDLRDAGAGGPAARVVAVDMPSGICSDSGRALVPVTPAGAPAPAATVHARADLTVSFHRRKLGHCLAEGAVAAGRVVVKDIGLDAVPASSAPAPAGPRIARVTSAPDARDLAKSQSGHKYAHGHALILSGGPGHTGAARLAARGALRIGAGLVTLGVPPAAQSEAAAQVTAIMLRRVADAPALGALLRDDRLNALCLGPGLGLGADRAALVSTALAARRATVLDADALTLVAGDPALFELLHDRCVLTPHGGEFKRLFPDLMAKLEVPPTEGPAWSKVDATRSAARRAGCTVLFKGPDTVVAAPDGHCAVNAATRDRAAPWLATAGAGDVLAGFVAGLLARGFTPLAAAESAAWLHVEAALQVGPGLIAEDLPEALPGVLAAMGV